MSDYITDREIERLALGELDEAAANELMKRLEERGELERLEAIIADDEVFLEAHPPALLATQVRAEVRRRSREHQTTEASMLRPSRGPLVIGFAFAAAAVAFAVVYVQMMTPTPSPNAVASTNNGQTNLAAPAPVPAEVEEPVEDEELEDEAPVTLLERDVKVALPPTFYLPAGEIVQAEAAGLQRIAFSNTKAVSASMHEELIYIEAKAPGQSMLLLGRNIDDEVVTRSSLFIVGEAFADEVTQTLIPELADCAEGEEGILVLRVVSQNGASFVGHAHVGGKEPSSSLRACLDSAVASWKVADHVEPHVQEGHEFPGPRNLSVGVLRYNLSAGAVCVPGEDGC